MNSSTDTMEILQPTEQALSVPRWSDWTELFKLRLNTLVLITTLVGFFLASEGSLDWTLLLHTLAGTALSAAGASALNQFMEREIDLRMPRTRRRPLPAGRLQPAEALVVGLMLCVLGVTYLRFAVNPLTAGLSFATIVIYLAIYTPLKRITTLNTLVGAIPGAIPPVMGVAAASNQISFEAWILFSILFFWQIPHFLAIATMYRDDYAAGSLKMLPVVQPDLGSTVRQTVFYCLLLVGVSLVPWWAGSAGWVYGLLAALAGGVFLASALRFAGTRRRTDARRVFFTSILYLPVLLAILMIAN